MEYKLKKVGVDEVDTIKKGQNFVYKTKGKNGYPNETMRIKTLSHFNKTKNLLLVTVLNVKGSKTELYRSDFENGFIYRRVKK